MSDTQARTPQAQTVVDAIDRLPPTERALLDLSVRHAMDDAEIGAIVGLDPAEVTRLRLGVLERMTAEFAEAGLGRWGALGAALNEVGAEGPVDEDANGASRAAPPETHVEAPSNGTAAPEAHVEAPSNGAAVSNGAAA